MTSRRAWWISGVLALTALAALLVAASGTVVKREFVLGAPDQAPVAVLQPSQRVCEGPVASRGPFQRVGIWGSSAGGLSRITVEVQDARTARVLASGRLDARTPREDIVRLDSEVPGAQPLRICLVGNRRAFLLLGSQTIQPGVQTVGLKPGLQFSLVLLSDRQSLLSSLPTAFSRASLFRPSWVGPWTFWVLALGLVAAFALGVIAVAGATAADAGESPASALAPSGPIGAPGSFPDRRAGPPDPPSRDPAPRG